MKEYDSFTKAKLPEKIPVWKNKDPRLRVGDSIYDFSSDSLRIRKGPHNKKHSKRDLSGKFALLSEHFYYFGDNPVDLPKHLEGIVCTTQGHQSQKNDKYIDPFQKWLDGLGLKLNKLYGKPSGELFQNVPIKDLKNECIQCCIKRIFAS